jgi:hypothetical protein
VRLLLLLLLEATGPVQELPQRPQQRLLLLLLLLLAVVMRMKMKQLQRWQLQQARMPGSSSSSDVASRTRSGPVRGA